MSLAQLMQPPYTIKVYQLDQGGKQKVVYNNSFKTKSDVILSLTDVPLHETQLLQINNMQVFSTIKLETLRSQEISLTLSNLYQFISDAKNNQLDEKNSPYKLPDCFIVHFKAIPQNQSNLQIFFSIFSKMYNYLQQQKRKKRSVSTGGGNNSFINLDALDQPERPSISIAENVNYKSPELQKQMNDNLILALNEAHQRIKELEKTNQKLVQQNQKYSSPKQQPQTPKKQEEIDNSSQVFQTLPTRSANLDISPIKNANNQQPQQPINVFQELQTSLNKSYRPSLVDLSQQPVDQELFDEYNVNDEDVKQAVVEKMQNASFRNSIHDNMITGSQNNQHQQKIDNELNQIIEQSPLQGTPHSLQQQSYSSHLNKSENSVQTDKINIDNLKLDIPPGSSKQTLLQSIMNVTKNMSTVLTSPMKSVDIGVRYDPEKNDIEIFEIEKVKTNLDVAISPSIQQNRPKLAELTQLIRQKKEQLLRDKQTSTRPSDIMEQIQQSDMQQSWHSVSNVNQEKPSEPQEKSINEERQDSEKIQLKKVSLVQKAKKVFSPFAADAAQQAKPVETKVIQEQKNQKLLQNVDKKSYLYLQNIQTVLQKHKQAVNQANSQLKQHNIYVEQKKKQASFVEDQETQSQQKNDQISSGNANFIKFVQMND